MQVTEFCNKVKLILPNTIYNIIGEVNQLKYSHGHLYFNLKDTNSNIKCIVWKSKLEKIKIEINDGDKVSIDIKLDFYSFTGSLNFIVDKIIKNDGVGDLYKEYNKIKNDFEEKGYFTKNKLHLPCIIKNILIITSENGAAIKDFLFNLENNKSKINYIIDNVPVQGYDCHKIISNRIKDIHDNKIYQDTKIDAIIITRGGGSFQDLFAFSEPELIMSIYKYKKYPIISAIGHQIDNPLLDLVADISCPTPSLASQYLIDHNKKFIYKLEEIKYKFYNNIKTEFYNQQKKYIQIKNKLKLYIESLTSICNEYKKQIEKRLSQQKEKLNLIKTEINCNMNGIHIFKNETEILHPENIMINDILNLVWNNKKFKISITEIL